MVRFEEKKLIIEIDTICPLEEWVELKNGLCDVVRNVKSESIIDDSFYCVIDFLRELMPDWEDLKKMKS